MTHDHSTSSGTPGFDSTRFESDSFAPMAVTTRNGLDESLHLGAGVATSRNESETTARTASIGDPDLVVYPRSSLKPMQADAMVEAGLDLPLDLLAVTCASHNGEAIHLDAVERILATAGLTESDLQNTADSPYGPAARTAAIASGIEKSSLQQNCSGKHAAMLVTCRINGWSIENYLELDHPLQQMITEHVARLGNNGTSGIHVGVDGCGAPTHAIPLSGLANAFGWLASTDSEVAQAMAAYPLTVGGTGRDVTTVMEMVPGLIAKDGAQGVMAAALPDGRAVAYKIADGSDEARRAVLPAALRAMGVEEATVAEVESRLAVPVLGHGLVVGEVRALNWDRE